MRATADDPTVPGITLIRALTLSRADHVLALIIGAQAAGMHAFLNSGGDEPGEDSGTGRQARAETRAEARRGRTGAVDAVNVAHVAVPRHSPCYGACSIAWR